jgi:hypothetical protein
MPRRVRPPREIDSLGDGRALVVYARDIAQIVARYTSHTEQHVLESIMRVVGHLCSTGAPRRG